MIRPDQIPDAVVEATGLPEIAARAVIAAAINAWPGAAALTGLEGIDLVMLPIAKQKSDDPNKWWDDTDTYGAS